MDKAQERQHFQSLLNSQSEFYWEAIFSHARTSAARVKIVFFVTIAVVILFSVTVGSDPSVNIPILENTYTAALFWTLPTNCALLAAAYSLSKVNSWVDNDQGSLWLSIAGLILLNFLCLIVGAFCAHSFLQRKYVAALSRYNATRDSKFEGVKSKGKSSLGAGLGVGDRDFEEFMQEFDRYLAAKGSQMTSVNYSLDELRYAWVNGVGPSEFLSMPERPRLSEADLRRSHTQPFSNSLNTEKKVDLVFEDLKYLGAYYKELQEVLEQKRSKMVATDYHEDEVRHAWAHGVSPQKFLSMAVRPRLDDSTCRKQFPGLDYSFVESPVVEAVQGFVTEDRTDFVESEGISILANEENHLDAQAVESKQDQLLEEVSINELERVRVDDVATRLRRVETLFEQNLITAEERERQRAVILSDL